MVIYMFLRTSHPVEVEHYCSFKLIKYNATGVKQWEASESIPMNLLINENNDLYF